MHRSHITDSSPILSAIRAAHAAPIPTPPSRHAVEIQSGQAHTPFDHRLLSDASHFSVYNMRSEHEGGEGQETESPSQDAESPSQDGELQARAGPFGGLAADVLNFGAQTSTRSSESTFKDLTEGMPTTLHPLPEGQIMHTLLRPAPQGSDLSPKDHFQRWTHLKNKKSREEDVLTKEAIGRQMKEMLSNRTPEQEEYYQKKFKEEYQRRKMKKEKRSGTVGSPDPQREVSNENVVSASILLRPSRSLRR